MGAANEKQAPWLVNESNVTLMQSNYLDDTWIENVLKLPRCLL
jgi:hypothetical protein